MRVSTAWVCAFLLSGTDAARAEPRSDELPDDRGAVVLIDGLPLRASEVEALVRLEAPAARRKLRGAQARRTFVEKQVDLRLLAAEAERRGLMDDPEVQRILRYALAKRLIDAQIEQRYVPSDADLRALFEARRADYERPALRRVAMIVLRAAGDREGALKEAERLRQEAEMHRADGAHFRRLVEQHSDDAESRVRGGATDYFTRDEASIPREVRETAFSLRETGDVAIVVGSGAVRVVRLIGLRRATSPSFEHVRDRVKRSWLRSRREAAEATLVRELRDRADVKWSEKTLRRLRLD